MYIYRPDIDGLRAFAVFSVILFHLDFEFARGGFIGVDIFFVISGFLITGIITREVKINGRFNYTNFYIRRIRRIFPALFITIIFTMSIAIMLFSPLHLERLGGSIIHALASLSNFYFWTEAGYFDSAADVKPLLHTWSLSIEEQFYFIWPLLIVFLMKKQNKVLTILTLVSIIIISLYLNHIFQDGNVNIKNIFSEHSSEFIINGQSTIFYLLPFRLYEFAIGGALVYLSNYSIKSKIINEIIMFIGLMLVTYAFLMFSDQTLFPSYNALIPVLGTALIIFSGNKSEFIGRLFNNRVAIGIGLISYSLYLVHWPIIVFWKYYTFETISLFQSFLIIILSFIIASLMYKYVEQPFRLKKAAVHNKSIATSGVILFFIFPIVIAISSNLWVNKGWPWRVMDKPDSSELVAPKVKLKKLEKLETKWANAYTIGDISEDTKRILVLGDSHAAHLSGLAKYLSNKYNLSFTFYTFIGCPPIFGTYKVYGAPNGLPWLKSRQEGCRNQTKIWEEYVLSNKFDYVILSSRWNWLFEPKEYYDTNIRCDLLIDKSNPKFSRKDSREVFSSFLDYSIKTIHASGAKAIVFGQVPHAGKNMDGCNNVPRILISNNGINSRCNHVPRELVLKRNEFSNTTIRHISKINDAISVIPTDYFCVEDEKFCKVVHNGWRLKNDDDHINEFGSVYLAKEWESSNDFPFKSITKDDK